MLYLTEQFALPETKQEFVIVELDEGIHRRIDAFFEYGITLDHTCTNRTALARKFTIWFIEHWRTVQRIADIHVEQEYSGPFISHTIHFSIDSTTGIVIKFPELSKDTKSLEIAYRMNRIIRVVTGQSKNGV
jgi:hypothetical protein